ncbi:MAG: acetyl-CoA carboxylase carboxyltransferase subunit alpha [Chloroflexi bacterium AL-W]|nr:acetyl-CoA carboxylase carboxyltransferase subunit alpha [Chloroflexi bacterium AL-N1]NOK67021.1 acetyl-CoA carboxylase carboxyltransferase subunit alpha [Chloroflexi bacterium AL-N10]NOK74687.1 acetyl-CoA carboxylase carboxyltransferase subunit alpha [Chloroflexi bacterium AL-N5]NOK81623.1 acetyl-CoA carboxylase carboxyltransferase subunit alpha [Chloroflexi bacterium AL-W]NOK89093.1 acetyl-CoA carboxylase carboxyltransferase subunit alpha [Chloroflexi bacterium AL-N15]
MTTLLTPWEKIQVARHPQRPHTLDYITNLCEDFVELHGDRRFGDDAAMVGGIARFHGHTVVVVGHQKGRDTRENVHRNFGMPKPEGYRKALRLFQYAEKFQFPVLSFIDTPGAFPDMESEERGQGSAIAENILVMAGLHVPIITTVVGEGGSGGALAIGVGDRLLMLEHSVYSVASPEGSAAILWRDSSKAADAAQAMRITAQDLHEFAIADHVIPEPDGGAHTDLETTIMAVRDAILPYFNELHTLSSEELLTLRYNKYRAIGRYYEGQHEILSHHDAQLTASLPLPFS